MARNIIVEELKYPPMEQQPVEIVERKGVGHPDSVADGLSEAVSRALCRMYLERYGRILHHNTDETQIVGGQSSPKFGGGEVLEPIYILLVGRAVTEVNGERLPYRATAVKAARDYLKANFPNLNVDMDVMIDCRINKGSADLRAVYDTRKLLANDTSFGVGYAPLSETESITYQMERYLNTELKREFPAIGEDIKVMSARTGEKISITVAVAVVDKYIADKEEYISTTQTIRERLSDYAQKHTSREVKVELNTADDPDGGIFYLTVTGLSMENGDDGSVGRGNRVNGLITPYRPMSMEAAAGKNPVTHVGKLYNILSHRIARAIVDASGGDILEAHVWLQSQIGKPIDQPKTASIKVIPSEHSGIEKAKKLAYQIADEQLENISDLTQLIVDGKISVF